MATTQVWHAYRRGETKVLWKFVTQADCTKLEVIGKLCQAVSAYDISDVYWIMNGDAALAVAVLAPDSDAMITVFVAKEEVEPEKLLNPDNWT